MKGRAADEAEERAYIESLSEPERANSFREAVERLAAKWLVPEDRRRDLRTALGYPNVVAGVVYYGEVQRCAIAEERLRKVVSILRSVEWGSIALCPTCDRWEPDGHAEDCALAAALRQATPR